MIENPDNPNILMHSDEALETALGSKITGRKTIHEWPLSCVQELCLDNGTKWAYKSQLPPTVEPGFYDRATSKLLPGYRSLGTSGNCSHIIIEWIDAPKLGDMAVSESELVGHGRQLVAQIGEIDGDLPAYLDIGSADAWSAACQSTFGKLDTLVKDRRFRWVDLPAIKSARSWAATARVNDAITENPRLTHGDLKADQVFVTAGGYRIIDWQRPVIAPPEIDLVALLADKRIDPCRYADPSVVGIFWFLRLHWAVEAQYDLFPEKRWPLFDNWAAEAITKINKLPV